MQTILVLRATAWFCGARRGEAQGGRQAPDARAQRAEVLWPQQLRWQRVALRRRRPAAMTRWQRLLLPCMHPAHQPHQPQPHRRPHRRPAAHLQNHGDGDPGGLLHQRILGGGRGHDGEGAVLWKPVHGLLALELVRRLLALVEGANEVVAAHDLRGEGGVRGRARGWGTCGAARAHLLELAEGDGRRERHALLLRGRCLRLLRLLLRLLHDGDHVLLQAAGRLPDRGLCQDRGWHAGGWLLGRRC